MGTVKSKILQIYQTLAIADARIRCRNNGLRDWQRIYHFHIRKTAGTSLNQMFLALSGLDAGEAYQRLLSSRFRMRRIGKLVFAAWNKDVLNAGAYFFGFSHIPQHQLSLPQGTYRVAVFRDPAERVISHYKMLRMYRQEHINHPCMEVEGEWLGEDFNDFLQNIPDQHLKNQLYMFSENMDPVEASENVFKLENFFFTEDFNTGIEGLNADLGLALMPVHFRKTAFQPTINEGALHLLKERLSGEYKMLEMLKIHKQTVCRQESQQQ